MGAEAGWQQTRGWRGDSVRITLFARDLLWGWLRPKKPCSFRVKLEGLFHDPLWSASHQRFFFLDKRFEISNLKLIRDIACIIKLEETSFNDLKIEERDSIFVVK
jgi:hypothetical protein